MCEKRVMVHFDEANSDLHRYVSKHRNKSDFIRECIRYRMEKEKDLKEVVKLIQELNYEHMSKKWG